MDFATLLARLTNCSVTMVTVGMPRFWASTVSWILHEVQPPQAASPTTAQSAFLANSSHSFAQPGSA